MHECVTKPASGPTIQRMRHTSFLQPKIVLLLLATLLTACGGTPDSTLRLRKVVLYQNGIGYFEHTGQAEAEQLRIPVRRFELDDAIKTLTVVSTEGGEVMPRHGIVHTMTGDTKNSLDDDQRKVHMDVQVPGAHGEDLRISYSVPTPIWKATYRVLFDKTQAGKVLLQGWASIQNTSGDDWRDVSLTLATGAPLSFSVNLTRPHYASRPDLTGKMVAPVATGAIRASRTTPKDSDGDGIVDIDDTCPSSPEDIDGYEDDDGCPEPDNDGDRVLDVDDLCPGESETYNGIEDGDGCPDRAQVVISDNRLSILDKIYFGHGKVAIRTRSHRILDAVAATLLGNPQVESMEVSGHAASNEKNSWDKAEQRALSVAAYLKKAGVPSERLRIRVFGDSRPIDSNSNKTAFERNRRVEFLLVEPEYHVLDESAIGESQRNSAVAVPKTSTGGGMIYYTLPGTVTIAEGESTLLPLVNASVEGEEIYLYRPQTSLPGSDKHPTRAARIVNNGDLTLIPGPVAVFARDAFAGEGLLESLRPGESAFIPFALDRTARVTLREVRSQRPKRIVSIVDSVISVVDEHQIITEYAIGVGLLPPARAFVQHQGHLGYTLAAPPGSESMGTTTLVPLRLSGGQNATLGLVERAEQTRSLSIEYAPAREIRSYLAANALPSAVATKVERVLALREGIELKEGTLKALRGQRLDDQLRAHEIRQNLRALSQGERQLRAKLRRELSQSEKRGSTLASRIAKVSEALTKERIESQLVLAGLSLSPR